jgi:hypothetical protein
MRGGSMKKVLLIGDSIRLGYQQFVQEGLRDRAEVVGPEDNGRFSKYTLWGINLWIKELNIDFENMLPVVGMIYNKKVMQVQ